MRLASLLLVPFVAFAACTQKPETDAELVKRADAPLFTGMGEYHRAINTKDAGAQRYFDQGLVLAFGFNHAEAIRSFRAAQKLDPDCAMCFWGEALATGPNINVTAKGKAIMSDDEQKAAWAALRKAKAVAANKPEVERDLIDALGKRYAPEPVVDRDTFDHAYAEALGALVKKYPEDDDIASMYGEAWMNTMPWDYWSDATTPRPEIAPVIAALESTIARSPKHPLALHLYIHAMEASASPEKAEMAADALYPLVPGSGHLVHMPSHIFYRVGRYNDSVKANEAAAKVDEDYIKQCNAQGFYPAMYYPHNIHFLWSAASMQGQSKVALQAAKKLADNVSLEQIDQFPTIEFFKTVPLLTIADNLLLGEIAMAGKDMKTAIASFEAAVTAQDALPYTEPPFWYYPTRQSLGFALLKAGKAKEAQAVYEADLKQYMHNGWSTFGLIQALDAQGKTADADMQREHFKAMWQFSDIELKGSRVSASPI
ncbi:MAG: hypothetical protein EOP61_12840 [Sphingomonadales bacterium]|nr:MAG: hypothetical protein EOP61_12840 [Sphingomonadales bacterium]